MRRIGCRERRQLRAGGAGVGWEAYTGVKVTVPDSGEGVVLYSPAACVECTLKKDDDDSNEAKNYETASIFFRKVEGHGL